MGGSGEESLKTEGKLLSELRTKLFSFHICNIIIIFIVRTVLFSLGFIFSNEIPPPNHPLLIVLVFLLLDMRFLYFPFILTSSNSALVL